MTMLKGAWITFAFLAGCLFWAWLGPKILRYGLGRKDITENVVKELSQDRLIRLARATAAEVERRKKGLAE